MVRTGRLIQIGNSVGFTLPKPIARALRLRKGDDVLLGTDGELLIIRKVDPRELTQALDSAKRSWAAAIVKS